MRAMSVLAANGREAAESLRRAGLRTALGLIGVTIGVSSVIAMVSLGEIAKEQARKQFEALGTDIVVVRDRGGGVQDGIDLQTALNLQDSIPSILRAAPRIMGYGSFLFAGKDVGQGSVQGVTHSFAIVNKIPVKEGRFISNLDINRNYGVVGAEIAKKMRGLTQKELLGELIDVDGTLFTVVGVLEQYEESYALPVNIDANRSIFIPITTANRTSNEPHIEVIIALSAPGIHHETAAQDISNYLRTRSPKLQLDIVTAKELIAQMERQMGIFTLLLGGVGSISLVVGGIGVMNIMLVSVAERRVEIAIRRALGAQQSDIRSQFLIESIILTSAGGILGVALGLAATYAISQFTGWEFLISWISVASGLGTAAAVGLFFGFQPAYQASKLDPIAGLQGS
ncbi:MAG: ABC transporter permease [Aestuariivita sp.]|nr:ABC transporter permease [Aestuariivita sp.]